MAQKDFRLDLIIKFVVDNGYSLDEIDIFVGRGGLLRPLASGGAYIINERMIADLRGQYGNHASNLGAVLAHELAAPRGNRLYRRSRDHRRNGRHRARERSCPHPRRSVFHALNQKAMAIRYAEEVNQSYRNLNLIVVHLGGGSPSPPSSGPGRRRQRRFGRRRSVQPRTVRKSPSSCSSTFVIRDAILRRS